VLPPLSAATFQKQTGVSRETLVRLEAYVELLSAWNRRINLVGPRTLSDVWRRHILDSAQLFPLVPRTARVLLDVGSGAGLPGLILAILGLKEVHLVEADQRKCAFLREAARITGAPAHIHAQRLEKCPGISADVITARAFAPLSDLLDKVCHFIEPHSILLFLKGKTVGEELTEARKGWNMRATLHPSASDPSGTVLRLEQVIRAEHDGGTARHP
jgi:16S rRNA (guanine527-N7)-methyltransferase